MSYRCFCFFAFVLIFSTPFVAIADNNAIEVSGYEEAFRTLRQIVRPEDPGTSVEDIIAQFYEEGEEDKGTYPASEYFERGNTLKRTQPPQLRYSGRMFFRTSDDSISQTEKWEKLFEMNLRYTDWDAYFRVSDYNVFAYVNDPLRLEKARLRYRGDDTTVIVGSFGALFGRGLTLSMFEDTFVDHDNEAEGFKLEQDLGDSDPTVLWGARKDRDEPHHSEVYAARFEVPLGDAVDLGIHRAHVEFPMIDPGVVVAPSRAPTQDLEPVTMLSYELTGSDITIREGAFRFYAEQVSLQRDEVPGAQNEFDVSGESGAGFYAQTGYSGDGYAVNLEYKDYDGIEQPFAVLPPVRRWREAASATPNDDKGYGVHVILTPVGDGSSFEFSYARDNRHAKLEPYNEFGAVYNSSYSGETSWIAQYWRVRDGSTNHDWKQLTINHRLSEDWSSTAVLERERLGLIGLPAYTDYLVEVDLAFKSVFNAAYTIETTGLADAPADDWEIFEFKYRPDQEQEFNLVFGERREGYVCSGGICRLEPAFDGYRIDYLLRF